MKHMFGALVTATILAATAAAAEAPVMTGDSAKGEVLTDANGMTLYIFDNDTASTSNCYDKCAQNWPPLAASADAAAAGDFGIVERTDGTKQWAYKGMPLYLWVKDGAAGDITGDGINGVWHIAKP